MSAIKHYDVEQTRKVRVWAHDEARALSMANAAFYWNADLDDVDLETGSAVISAEVVEVKITRV